MEYQERPFGSMLKGKLPTGCRYCEKGGKLVLLVTGLCRYHCFYCPVSEEKIYKDVIFADELRVSQDSDIIDEARNIDALGAGITGGDPLDVTDRTCHYIRLLKSSFGRGFHIHLYTATTDLEKIAKVADAGLDEIRSHPFPSYRRRMKGSRYEKAIRFSLDKGLDVGIEVPLLPDRKGDLVALIEWADNAEVKFVNLDELEFSDGNWMHLRKRGYEGRSDVTCGVKGCDDVARDLMSLDVATTIHYCSSSYKDGVQLRNRIRRRARNVAKEHEVITDDGTLLKGVVECPEAEVQKVREELIERFHIAEHLIRVDEGKKRIEVAPWILEKIAAKVSHKCFIVEEYPTADRLEVERMSL